jgi:hypothetical protein
MRIRLYVLAPLFNPFLLLVTYEVTSAIPIRFNIISEHVVGAAHAKQWHIMQNFAIVIKFDDGFSTILPVSADIVSGRSFSWMKHSGYNNSRVLSTPTRVLHSTP